ncbi:MAG: zf-HC2 domain-containing protein [Sulfitobacter sp.]
MNMLLERSSRRIRGILFKLPGMITCEVFESFILAYLEDELSPDQRRVFERHLKVCRSCRQYLADYRMTLAATQSLSVDDKVALENVPEDLITAILAAHTSADR